MPNIWDDENNELNNIIGKYNEWHSYMEKKDQAADPNNIINAPDEEPDAARQAEAAEKWKDFDPEEQRNRIIEILDKEKKSADYPADEREEMHFISETLKRGWLVSDIEMLRDRGAERSDQPGRSHCTGQIKCAQDYQKSYFDRQGCFFSAGISRKDKTDYNPGRKDQRDSATCKRIFCETAQGQAHVSGGIS